MKTEAEFEKFFQTTLLGDLNELEISRQKVVGKVRILLFFELIIIIGIGLYLFLYQSSKTGSKPELVPFKVFWIFFSLIILGIIFVIFANLISKKYKSGFKEGIIRKIINQIGKDITYSPGDKVEMNEFRDSGIFKMYNDSIARYTGRDLITRRIGDITYRFSWIDAEYKKYESGFSTSSRSVRSSSRTSYYKLFRGIFFIADFGTPFPANALVWPNILNKSKLGGIVHLLQDKSIGNRVNLEDLVFEEEYTVYGEDVPVIKRMITPGLRQWILDFRAKSQSRLYLSFTGLRMNIGVSLKKNLFEPSIFKKVTDYNLVFENFQYLLLFNGLLEDLSKKH